MRQRHDIWRARQAGLPAPWTKDKILGYYKFTNVFRELDKTTVWFKENVRDKYDGDKLLLLATVVFRMFNRMETGDSLFKPNLLLGDKQTPFERYAASGDPKVLLEGVERKPFPYVTGAHMVYAVPHKPLHHGMVELIDDFYHGRNLTTDEPTHSWKQATRLLYDGLWNIEHTFNWLSRHRGIGNFIAYEIATDLRHTKMLRRADDIMTWANPGPGSVRGLNRVHKRKLEAKPPREQCIQEMRDLLECGLRLWPSKFPALEIRDVEHSLCEWDKYERVRLKQGKPRGVYFK